MNWLEGPPSAHAPGVAWPLLEKSRRRGEEEGEEQEKGEEAKGLKKKASLSNNTRKE